MDRVKSVSGGFRSETVITNFTLHCYIHVSLPNILYALDIYFEFMNFNPLSPESETYRFHRLMPDDFTHQLGAICIGNHMRPSTIKD